MYTHDVVYLLVTPVIYHCRIPAAGQGKQSGNFCPPPGTKSSYYAPLKCHFSLYNIAASSYSNKLLAHTVIHVYNISDYIISI